MSFDLLLKPNHIIALDNEIENNRFTQNDSTVIAPHCLVVCVPWYQLCRASPGAIASFKDSLHAQVLTYISDQLYKLINPVEVEVKSSPFGKDLRFKAGYGKFKNQVESLRADKIRRFGQAMMINLSELAELNAEVIATIHVDKKTHDVRLNLDSKHASALIGRAEECDVRLDHPSVAPLHASLSLSTDGLMIADLNSKSGTRLGKVGLMNGAKTTLEYGETVRFGSVEVSFRHKLL